MKSCIWCVCAVAILVVSTTAFAEIVDSGEGYYYSSDDGGPYECSPTGHSPSVGASGGSEESAWRWETASGWFSKHTTEAGYFTWSYTLVAWAHASVNLSNEFQSCCGGASASASGSGPDDSDGHGASAYADSGMFQGEYYIPDSEFPNDVWSSYEGEYDADTSVSTSYSCNAYAGVILYSDDTASGASYVSATCTLN